LLFLWLGLDLDPIFQQIGNHPQVGWRIAGQLAPVSGRRLEHTPLDYHLGDRSLAHFLDELRVLHRRLGHLAIVELVEHGHQNKTNHQPDCQILEHVIQCFTSSTLPGPGRFPKPCLSTSSHYTF
jgi:hypothetical protein